MSRTYTVHRHNRKGYKNYDTFGCLTNSTTALLHMAGEETSRLSSAQLLSASNSACAGTHADHRKRGRPTDRMVFYLWGITSPGSSASERHIFRKQENRNIRTKKCFWIFITLIYIYIYIYTYYIFNTFYILLILEGRTA